MTPEITKEEFSEYLKTHTRQETRQHFKMSFKNFIAHLRHFEGGDCKFSRKQLPEKEALESYISDHTQKEAMKHFGLGEWILTKALDLYEIKPIKIRTPKLPKVKIEAPPNTMSFTDATKVLGVSRMMVSTWNKLGAFTGVIETKHKSYIPIGEVTWDNIEKWRENYKKNKKQRKLQKLKENLCIPT